MAEIVCACGRQLSGTDTERSRAWYCKHCRTFGAMACVQCGTREGFPRAGPSITPEEAARSPKASATDVLAKSAAYCAWCLHDSYFTVTSGRMGACVLCETTWHRRGPAVHADGVPMRA